MKKLSIIVAFIVLAIVVNAQEFKKGSIVASAGIGVGHAYGFYPGTWSFPSLIVSGEFGIIEIPKVGIVSAGGAFAYKYSRFENLGYSLGLNDIYFTARGAFHLTMIKINNLDVYGGLALGIRSYQEPTTFNLLSNQYLKETRLVPISGIFVGARYYFLPKMAELSVFGEAGIDNSLLKIGFSYKIQ